MSVRMACMQVSPAVGELDGNRRHSVAAIKQVAAFETEIVLLPELMSSGHVFDSLDEARGLGEPADGETVSAWAEFAARFATVIIGGFAELGDDGHLYNSAAVVGPAGLLAVYRKTHLWDREKLWFTPGSEPPPVWRRRSAGSESRLATTSTPRS